MTSYHTYNSTLGTMTCPESKRTVPVQEMQLFYEEQTIAIYLGCYVHLQKMDFTPEEGAIVLAYMIATTGTYRTEFHYLCL